MKRRNLLAAVLSFSLVIGMSAPVDLAQESKKTQTAVSIEDSVGETSKYGYLPIHRKLLNSDDLSSGRKKKAAKTTIPSSFNAREEGLLTDIKDQGETGMCWTMSVMGASEADIIQDDSEVSPDLSEYHLAYSTYNKADDPLGLTVGDICRPREKNNDLYGWGGNSVLATATLARWQGVVDESVASFEDLQNKINRNVTADLPDEVMYDKDSYHLQNVEYIYMTKANRNQIKQKLMEYGAAECSMYAPETSSDEQMYGNTGKSNFTAYYCDDTSKTTNHSVLIVGWDDNYSASNFNSKCRPSSDGAWLIRNSWGDCNSMGGYFWISYEDAMLQAEKNEEAEVAFFDVEKVDNYDNNYQYDGGIPFAFSKSFLRGANVFEAKADEKMQAVSFYTQEANVNYEVSIYESPDSDNPMSGKLVSSLSGTIAERGYHTIDFVKEDKDEVFMTKGKRYAVVVKLEESGDTSYQTYECTYNNSALTEAVSANEGESYVQYSDGEWEDFSKLVWSGGRKNNANLCIKMFSDTWDSTKATPTPVPTATLTPVPTATPTPVPTATPTPVPTATPTPMPTATPTPVPTATPTPVPTATPTPVLTATPTATPVTTPTQKAQSTPAANNPTTPVVTDNPITLDNSSARTVVVKKLKFKYSSKKVKAGKKVKLSKWLKVTKNRAGDAKITYKFTKSKYKKYATLSKKGVFKAKKAGKKKTVYVKAAAGDGSKKTANIKIKIK